MVDSSEKTVVSIRPYEAGSPWVFKGRALYQLHMVKADIARKVIPKELKLVEAFGYTLGGFFLAHYDGSPAGEFDEAVIIPGIVWNPPTSCAWAGRVLVGSEEARDHGRKFVGLPSFKAEFSYSVKELVRPTPWWDARRWLKGKQSSALVRHSVDIVQRDSRLSTPLCSMAGLPNSLMTASAPNHGNKEKWSGPSIQLSLPNFSGKTKEQPNLLKYSCQLNCKVSSVSPVKITPLTEDSSEDVRDVLAVLTGKPLISIFFDKMVMSVDAPKLVEVKNTSDLQEASSTVPAAPSGTAT